MRVLKISVMAFVLTPSVVSKATLALLVIHGSEGAANVLDGAATANTAAAAMIV